MKKIMSTIVCILLLLSAVFAFSGCGEIVTSNYGDELIKNGSFESELDNWNYSGSKVNFVPQICDHSISEVGQTNLKYVGMTVSSGYAFLTQNVKVEPDAIYKVSVKMVIPEKITASVKDKPFEGAYIGFAQNVDFVGKKSITESKTGWDYTYSFYFKTEYSEVTLQASIGAVEKASNGTVYLDDVSMVKVDPTTVSMDDVKVLGRPNDGISGVLYIIFGAVIVLAIAVLAYRMISRHGYVNAGDNADNHGLLTRLLRKNWMIFVVIAVALVARVLLAYFYTGYRTGMNGLVDAGNKLVAGGLNTLTSTSGDVLPLHAYILWAVASLTKLVGATAGSGLALLIAKLPSIICDVVTIIFIYKLAKKFIGQVGGIIAGSIYAVLPTILTATSVWGATDSIFAMCALLTFYFILNPNGLGNGKRYTGLFIFFVAGVLAKIEMLWLVPIVAGFLIYNFIKKSDSRKAIIIGTILSVVAFYALSLPCFIDYVTAGRVFYVWEYYFRLITTGLKYALNNFGLYLIVGRNGVTVNDLSKWISLAFALLLFVFGLIIYFNKKSRLELILIGAFTLVAASTFSVDTTATSLVAGFTLLLAYAVISNERRVYGLAMIFALLGFLNSAYVLNALGSLIPLLQGNLVTYLAGDAFMIVMSVLQIIAVIYAGYLTYDVCVNDKLKQITYLENKAK